MPLHVLALFMHNQLLNDVDHKIRILRFHLQIIALQVIQEPLTFPDISSCPYLPAHHIFCILYDIVSITFS